MCGCGLTPHEFCAWSMCIAQLARVSTRAIVCRCRAHYILACFYSTLLFGFLGRPFTPLTVQYTTCARPSLSTRGTGLHTLECRSRTRTGSNTVITQPATAPVAEYIDSVRPPGRRGARRTVGAGHCMQSLSRSRRRSRRSCRPRPSRPPSGTRPHGARRSWSCPASR